jgi:phage terminase large subunit-like protein
VNAVCPALALISRDPEYFDRLSDAELVAACFDLELWLRPEQVIPRHDWRSYTAIAGRGWVKSFGIAFDINRRVENGEFRSFSLMAPNDDRVKEVQVDFLVSTSPPWFRAEAYRGGVRWPNGVVARSFTPQAPGRPRSGNFDGAWLCEIVDWQESTRLEAYHNIATATRTGPCAMYQDTTSKGTNEVIQQLLADHKRDPIGNVLVRGDTFQNPLLTRKYLQSTIARYVRGSRRYLEEILGQIFEETAGALWRMTWIDKGRSNYVPHNPELRIIALDPALSARSDADETGMIDACRDETSEITITRDMSGRYTPEEWATKAVKACVDGAAGVVIERNHLGDSGRDLIKVHGAKKGLRIVLLKKEEPFPKRRDGVIFIREVVSRESKATRAEAPAALYEQGKVHHASTFDALELQMTTWEPGATKSPNRLDALAFAVTELAGLSFYSKVDVKSDIRTAADAAAELHQRLVGRVRRRGIGL